LSRHEALRGQLVRGEKEELGIMKGDMKNEFQKQAFVVAIVMLWISGRGQNKTLLSGTGQ
jgi:hypothetical protein